LINARIVPTIVAVYLGGLFWHRFTAASAIWTIVTGLTLGISLFLLQEVTGIWSAVGLPPVHFSYMAVIIFLFAAFVLALVSALGVPRPKEELAGLTFLWGDMRPERHPARLRWVGDYRVLAAALLLLMTSVIVALW